MARWMLVTLVGGSLFVFGCGGEDKSSESSKTASGATGTVGVTPAVPPVPQVPGSTPSETGSGSSSGSSRSGNGSSGTNGSPGRGGSGKRKRGKRRSTTPGPPGGALPTGSAPDVKTDAGAFKLAKEICANVTLEGIAENFQISLKERNAEFVARVFSRSFPAGTRDAGYDGCLEGFRNPVKGR